MSTPPTIQQGPRNPDPPPTAASGVEVSLQDRMKGGFKENVWLHLRRVMRGDFLTEKATDEERRLLASKVKPITNPIAQDYAAWRKSVLWVAAAFMVIYALLEIATHKSVEDQAREATKLQLETQAKAQAREMGVEPQAISDEQIDAGAKEFIRTQIGEENVELLDFITGAPKFAVMVGAVLIVIAARYWADPRKSKRYSRLAWLVVFLTPFGVAFLPVTEMMDFSHLEQVPMEQRGMVKKIIGTLYALQVFIMIGPKAIALFPGIIRSSMSLKTLLPESPTPGWVMSIMGPMYALFLLVIISTINQAHGDFWLISGIISFIAGSLIYALRAERMARPHTPDEVSSIVRRIRRQAMWANVAGVVLVLIFIFNFEELEGLKAWAFIVGVVATVLLLTIVASDFIVALMSKGFRQQQSFVGSTLEGQLDQRFDALEGAGFTVLKSK
jgi:hypothetical protein